MAEEEEYVSIATIIVFILLIIYIVVGALIEKKKCIIGHETGVVLLLGLLISLILKLTHFSDEIDNIFTFNQQIFFYLCLPPIIFATGFNLKRKRFFENIGYILLFGIFGTFITFIIFSALSSIFLVSGMLYQYDTELGIYMPLKLNIMETMLVCSLLCSSDAIAAITIIKYEEQPRLFSLILGESIVNDAVAIILFNTVAGFVYDDGAEQSTFTFGTPFKILLSFLELGFFSISIGIIFGLAGSYCFKRLRFITISSIKETLLIFCIGYMAYGLAELVEMSGIIALLTSGVIMAHYGWYNLSPQGKHVSSVAFQIIGYGAEAFIFAYLGLTFFSFYELNWSWQFVVLEFFVIIVGRLAGTVGLIFLLSLCGHKKRVTYSEVLFISYAGLIRGAIAFALVLNIRPSIESRDVIVTTTLTLVVITTLIFGTLMPIVQNGLVAPKLDDALEYEKKKEKEKENEEEGKYIEVQKTEERLSEHEEFRHPNLDQTKPEDDDELLTRSARMRFNQKYKKNTCGNYFKRFDKFIMRPIFIYNYNAGSTKKIDEFMDLFVRYGDKWEQMYARDEQANSDERKSFINILGSMALTPKVSGKNKLQRDSGYEKRYIDSKSPKNEVLLPKFGGQEEEQKSNDGTIKLVVTQAYDSKDHIFPGKGGK